MLRVLCLALIVAAAYAAGPSPVVWPEAWNCTWNFANTSTGAMLDGGNWFYDAPHGMLRQKGIPCSAIFRGGNMYYNIPTASFCCLCFKGLAITGPHWLSQATFVKQTTYNLTNEAANLWTFASNTQWYYETAANRLPLALSGFGTDMQWIGIVEGPQNPFVFSIPSTCNKQCPSAQFPECGALTPETEASLATYMLAPIDS